MKTENDYIKLLYRHFCNFEYKLNNSFIYDWECDFFGISKTGYAYEVEVKISRSDFFADFKKEKHNLFKALIQGKSHFIYGRPGWYADEAFVCKYINKKISFDYDGMDHGSTNRYRRFNWPFDRDTQKYIVNDYGKAHVTNHEKIVYAQHTSIRIVPFSEINIPNCFYYCCPDGMIKKEEVPPYAGLLYADENGITVVKKAPYLHRDVKSLTKILLNKFYYLWIQSDSYVNSY